MNDVAPRDGQNSSIGPVIEIRNLKKYFGPKKVLDDFEMQLHPGENLVVLGRSGSGKSVLIKCIIGLLKPDSGTIRVFGNDVTKLDFKGMDDLRRRVGFLFQSNALYDSMTVRENLEFPMRRHLIGLSAVELEKKIRETLEDVGLANTIDLMPAELSGGMQKRIALARTLILNPEVILYDEPTTGLDPVTSKEISLLINEVQEKYKASSIIITHDMNCAQRTSDRCIVLLNGKCYAIGTFEELQASGDENIKQFFE